MATIKDIAKLAGVSTSTVSHVLNKTRFVSEEISLKVLQAVSELNYAPSALARSLKTNHTKTFGMLVTTSTNPFFAEVVKGVEQACYEQGYSLILCNTEGDPLRINLNLSTLLQKRVDGLLLICSEVEAKAFGQLNHYPELPMVMMDWGPTDFNCDKIQDNSLLGGYLATQHLIEMGHTEIACICGPLDKVPAAQRITGFKQAMQDANLTINPDWIITGNFECDGGVAAYQALKQCQQQPTAAFICNDMMAMGFIHAANKDGISIPQQFSIVGYDDIELARYLSPALTTISQPKRLLGQKAVELLIDKISSKRAETQTIALEPSLVIRDSVIAK
ncbi:substrate-binding domain-containing protein [Shewanella marina]|uniref:substrate-binding domain-containing protein n=1 Tax=Shewanella marina TaxID=487319 RepID=UPI00046E918B|nr:substrate-binding domain-containing protein [Shewanella marina]